MRSLEGGTRRARLGSEYRFKLGQCIYRGLVQYSIGSLGRIAPGYCSHRFSIYLYNKQRDPISLPDQLIIPGGVLADKLSWAQARKLGLAVGLGWLPYALFKLSIYYVKTRFRIGRFRLAILGSF